MRRIIRDDNYNPLKEIFKYNLHSNLSLTQIFDIQKELFKGGIFVETGEEFVDILSLLASTQEQYNGKK